MGTYTRTDKQTNEPTDKCTNERTEILMYVHTEKHMNEHTDTLEQTDRQMNKRTDTHSRNLLEKLDPTFIPTETICSDCSCDYIVTRYIVRHTVGCRAYFDNTRLDCALCVQEKFYNSFTVDNWP